MEDNSRENEKPALSAEDKKKIIELTPEMEIRQENKVPIFDLSESGAEDLDGTVSSYQDVVQPSESPHETDPAGIEVSPEGAESSSSDLVPEVEIDRVTEPDVDGVDDTSFGQLDEETEILASNPVEENIIELEDIVGEPAPETEPVAAVTDGPAAEPVEEDIIELEDIVGEPAPETEPVAAVTDGPAAESVEEDIIELEDIVGEPAPEAEPVETTTDVQVSNFEEDDVIKLTDMVNATGTGITPAGATDNFSTSDTHEDGIVELTDIIDTAQADLVQDTDQEDVIDLVDMVDHADVSQTQAYPLNNGLREAVGKYGAISEEAIENYIRAKYRGNIEQLIAKVVEKAVQREIAAIRHHYLEDSDV